MKFPRRSALFDLESLQNKKKFVSLHSSNRYRKAPMDCFLLSPYAPALRMGADVLRRRIGGGDRIVVCIGGPLTYTNEVGAPMRDKRRDAICEYLAEREIPFYDSHIFLESHGRDYKAPLDDIATKKALIEAKVIVFPVWDYQSSEDAVRYVLWTKRWQQGSLRYKHIVVWWMSEALHEGRLNTASTCDQDRMGNDRHLYHCLSEAAVRAALTKALAPL